MTCKANFRDNELIIQNLTVKAGTTKQLHYTNNQASNTPVYASQALGAVSSQSSTNTKSSTAFTPLTNLMSYFRSDIKSTILNTIYCKWFFTPFLYCPPLFTLHGTTSESTNSDTTDGSIVYSFPIRGAVQLSDLKTMQSNASIPNSSTLSSTSKNCLPQRKPLLIQTKVTYSMNSTAGLYNYLFTNLATVSAILFASGIDALCIAYAVTIAPVLNTIQRDHPHSPRPEFLYSNMHCLLLFVSAVISLHCVGFVAMYVKNFFAIALESRNWVRTMNLMYGEDKGWKKQTTLDSFIHCDTMGLEFHLFYVMSLVHLQTVLEVL